MPPKEATKAPPAKSYSDHLKQAKQDFAAQLGNLAPPPARRADEKTSDYAHARSTSARGHETRADAFAKQGDHASAVAEYNAANRSRTVELKTKRDDQKVHTPGTQQYKQHEYYITQLAGDQRRVETAASSTKGAWVKTRADALRDAQ